MTCIAFDGKTFAADRRCSSGREIHENCKIDVSDDWVAASYGENDVGRAVISWLRGGADPKEWPSWAWNSEQVPAPVLVVWRDLSLWLYERTPYPERIRSATYAAGSGGQAARVAMHCGKSAIEAVQIASLFDSGCGNGVDAFDVVNWRWSAAAPPDVRDAVIQTLTRQVDDLQRLVRAKEQA